MTTPARALAAVAALVFTVLATIGTASADTPVSDDWPATEPISTLDTLLLFGGGTVGLFAGIWLLGLLLSRNNYVPPSPSQELATTSNHPEASHH